MDIVFVVDNSGSMQEEQSNLATNFPMFASQIQAYTVNNGQPLDFRVALTTTGRDIMYSLDLGPPFGSLPQSETGDDGEFRNTCNNPKRWLEPSDATMAQTLACRANVGTGGPSVEMPMLMTKWALKERAADTNTGFLRSDALLAVVMITDEDDASTTMNNFTMTATSPSPTDFHAQDLVGFLDQTKGNRTLWAAAVIAGDGNCSSSFGDAADAVRLKQFVTLANGNGSTQAVFTSICNGDLNKGLKDALDVFQAACGAIIL
ncbi:MAG TPA: vWA domain-containing protein [Kofleriaceae bacterium]